MNAAELDRLIDEDLRANPQASPSHGIDVAKCRVAPVAQPVLDSFTNEVREMWLVLREMPGEESGYLVYFDPECGEFGLAVYGKEDVPVYIGTYGTFTETLVGM